MTNRRQFLQRCAASAAGMWIVPALAKVGTDPSTSFPRQPHDRIAVASYPFRDFIMGSGHMGSGNMGSGNMGFGDKSSPPKIELKGFAAHVIEKFQVNKIEPWTGHFPSTDQKYLEQFRLALEACRAQVVNLAVDGERSPYAADRDEREQAIAFSKRWIDVAAAIGSPSIRANIPEAHDSKPDLERAASSLSQIVEYAQVRDVVVHLENDDPISEDPTFLVELIAKVNSPWLHALPDFANTLARGNPEYAYRSIDSLFAHAYGICHVKEWEIDEANKPVHVDMVKTFGILKSRQYKGYCSMEWDSPGDPYEGTAALVAKTTRYLSETS